MRLGDLGFRRWDEAKQRKQMHALAIAFRRSGPLIVAVFLSLVGTVVVAPIAQAATPTTFALRAPAGPFAVGDLIDVRIEITAGTEFVNAVQIDFTYPVSRLEFVSIDDSANGLPLKAPSITTTPGLI